jgi:dihydroflavonol-4-reductase
MFHTYYVTGASGFLGRAVVTELKRRGAEIRALVMKNDPLAAELPEGITVVYGNVCDDDSLDRFFSGADRNACVIHCAGIVSVASRPGERIYRVNAGVQPTSCGTVKRQGSANWST